MSKTVTQLKAEIIRAQKSWRVGMWCRLRGWQAHWPQQNAKIVGIVKETGVVMLDRKILNESVWHIMDLSKPFVSATPNA